MLAAVEAAYNIPWKFAAQNVAKCSVYAKRKVFYNRSMIFAEAVLYKPLKEFLLERL